LNKSSPDEFSSLALCPAENTTSTGRGAKDDQYSYLAPAISARIPAKNCNPQVGFRKISYLKSAESEV